MFFEQKQFILKDGREAFLKSPCKEDAKELLDFIIKASGETDFLMTFPEEFSEFTTEQEIEFINRNNNDENAVLICCIVDGKIAGNCQILFRSGMKDRHRAGVAIAILKEFWNLGIGMKMFEELIHLAKERGGIHQIELDFIEGNSRARGLYEKMGFRITGIKHNAIKMKDGTLVNEYMMIKEL